MKYYIQFMLICLFAVIGEALSTFFKLPVPGSIIGLFLLLIALQLKWIRLRHIHAVAEFLIANMTILFDKDDNYGNHYNIKNQGTHNNQNNWNNIRRNSIPSFHNTDTCWQKKDSHIGY